MLVLYALEDDQISSRRGIWLLHCHEGVVGSYVATKLYCCEELAGSYMAKKGLLVAARCYEGVAGSYVAVKGGSCSFVATKG